MFDESRWHEAWAVILTPSRAAARRSRTRRPSRASAVVTAVDRGDHGRHRRAQGQGHGGARHRRPRRAGVFSTHRSRCHRASCAAWPRRRRAGTTPPRRGRPCWRSRPTLRPSAQRPRRGRRRRHGAVRDSVVAALVSVGDRAETDDVCSGLMGPPTVDVLPSTPSVLSLPGYAAAMLRGGASMLQFCTTIEARTFSLVRLRPTRRAPKLRPGKCSRRGVLIKC
mmetsp:Transcript_17587/g.60850  ORF Transcript_17587/g.60850 Transcript_17587/m.60850 type:complete len:224 (+) Transcript_17587:674-1345(+)